MLRPQCFGELYRVRRLRTLRRFLGMSEWDSCAMGAAIEAAAIPVRTVIVKASYMGLRGTVEAGEVIQQLDFPAGWEGVLSTSGGCPAGCGLVGAVGLLIPHLNDEHRWTRETIADWVEAFEHPALAVPGFACMERA